MQELMGTAAVDMVDLVELMVLMPLVTLLVPVGYTAAVEVAVRMAHTQERQVAMVQYALSGLAMFDPSHLQELLMNK